MNKRKFYCFILFLFIATFSRSQSLNFKHISYKEGLVQSPISSFLQDDKGFIWFGNLKGLTRYDGYEFKTFIFDENDPKSLSNNRVNVIYQDHEQQIWVGTANGLNLYHKDNETFTPIDILEIKGGRNYISSIVEDQEGNIWVGTFAGIKRLNKGSLKLEDVFSRVNNKVLAKDAIFSLFVDKDDYIWAGTKKGIRKYNAKTTKEVAISKAFDEVKNLKVLVTKQDQLGNFWFGTETSGVYNYQPRKDKVLIYNSSPNQLNQLSSNWVKDILLFNDHEIWFATRNGISIFNTATQKFKTFVHEPLNPNSLSDNAIWSFMKDKANCVWVGTFAGGINFYYKGNANFQNIGEQIGNHLGLNHVLVNAISEDRDGSWWVGTFGGGLNHLDIRTQKSEFFSVKSNNQERPSNGIKSLADDHKGHLWIGCLDGLSFFDKRSKKFKNFKFPVKDGKLSENLISAILPDGQGAWIGTNGGGLRYVLPDGTCPIFIRKQELNHQTVPLELSDNFISAIIKDQRGNLWVGTQNGLDYYDKTKNAITKVFQKVRETQFQIDNSNILSLFIDSKRRLWIGTEGGGLNYFDANTERFYSISKSIGLGDDVIHGIIEDDLHHLWVSTDLGLYRIIFKTFSVPFRSKDLEITVYTANDGLINNQFSNNAVVKLGNGELVFGGMNGLSIFYPDKIIKNNLKPTVALTQVLVNNKQAEIAEKNTPLTRSIVEANRIVVPYDHANLSFTYSALNFINPSNNQYAYKLEGLSNDSDWQETGTQRIVNFANLSPGTYLFKVKAANNDNVWGEDVRALKIIVLPPWWATWWAYLLYTCCISFSLWIVIRFLRNRARLKRDLYLEHVHNIRQQELYQMKLNFFTNISHEIRTPLTLILGPLDKILRNSNSTDFAKPLNMMKNNADRLMKLVTELLDFRKAEEGHMKIHCVAQDIIQFCKIIFDSFHTVAIDQQIKYNFQAPNNPVIIYFDQDQLEKVIYNLLSNAFKFTPPMGEISLIIDNDPLNEELINIKVVDNGKGIPKNMLDKLFESFFQIDDRGRHNVGSGIGLALSKSIIELHKGKISVESDEIPINQTIFNISLRKGNQHLSPEEIMLKAEFDQGEMDLSSEIEKESSIIETAGLGSGPTKKYSIMIAEDNEEVRNLVVELLADKYKVLQFSTAENALKHMEQEIPDLIISDIMMPGMNGLDFCKQTKLSETTSHIPFILLTARAAISHQIDGLSKGADAYIPKPFSGQVLELNIKNLLHAQKVMREKFGQQFVLQPTPSNIVSPEEKFLNKLMGIIESKIEDSTFDVNDLVNEIGMSRTVLYKKVHSLTGYAVADLIKQIRLKKAAELFKENSFSVAEVAYMVGFNDRKHFSKEFKKQFNSSPTEYIQNYNSKE